MERCFLHDGVNGASGATKLGAPKWRAR